jgi:siroheme synthase
VTAGGTLVVLMGVAQRRDIAEALSASGVSASTPVACIGDATLETQRVVRGRLDQLGDLAITPPSVLVVGAVAALDFSGSSAGPHWSVQPG